MDRATVDRATRGVSPLLLAVAALAFLLLPMIGVSCNTSAASPVLGSAIGSLSGGSAGSGQEQQAQQCLQQLSNRDLVTYSGTTLAFGGTPHVDNSSLPACNTADGSSSINTAQTGIGIQALFLVGFILIVAAILLAALRAPLRNLLTAGTALVAFVLMLVGASAVHGPINDQINSSSGSNTLSSIGLSGSISSFFDIHAAIGLWLVIVLLLVTVVLNAGTVLVARTAPRTAELGSLPPPLPPPQPPPASYG